MYKKSQIGWFIISIFSSIILLLVMAYTMQWGTNSLSFVPFVVLCTLFLAVILMFYRLKVKLEKNILKLSYGIGIISLSFKIEKLHQLEIINTPWYYGLGIRVTPKGMLYNIQGSKALKIDYYTIKGKPKTIMIGTAEPKALKNALETFIERK